MTREEIAKSLNILKEQALRSHNDTAILDVKVESFVWVVESAIQALEQNESAEEWYKLFVKKLEEQEPCTDTVSREAVINLFNGNIGSEAAFILHKVKQLPPVTQKSGKWIPVNERLPEDEQEILFSTKTGRVHSGKYHDDDSANQWYSHRDKCRAWNNVVSAWMPLPKPYEPKESEDKE